MNEWIIWNKIWVISIIILQNIYYFDTDKLYWIAYNSVGWNISKTI